jgi:hypothetical protein
MRQRPKFPLPKASTPFCSASSVLFAQDGLSLRTNSQVFPLVGLLKRFAVLLIEPLILLGSPGKPLFTLCSFCVVADACFIASLYHAGVESQMDVF